MEAVYIVFHARPVDDLNDNVKFIGAFSSEARALEAVERLKPLPGFRDHPDQFSIDRHPLDRIDWSEGFGESEP